MSSAFALTEAPRLDHAGEASDILTIRTGEICVRHHAGGRFRYEHDGCRTVLLFLFSRERTPSAAERCPRGAFRLLAPGTPVSVDTVQGAEMLVLAFPEAVGQGLSALAEGGACAGDAGIRAIAQEIRRALRQEHAEAVDYIEHLAESLLSRATHVLARKPALRPAPAITAFNLQRVRDLVDERLGDHIAVADMAKAVGLSQAHFSRAFAAATGEPPHRYVLARRLDEVCRRLERGADDLTLLAAQTGFSSHAHMSAAFRQAYGVAPRDFRQLRAA